jgi:NAD(P)-dependent dehydrogenase (short-subunit alcohol dehydrogenase family)
VITGCNRGIGLAFVKKLVNEYKIICLVRQSSPELELLPNVEIIKQVPLFSLLYRYIKLLTL